MIVARTIFQFPRTPISVSFIPKRYKRNSKKDGSLKDGVTQIAEQIKGKPIDTKIDALVEDILSNKDGIKSLLDVFRGGKNTSDLFASIGADLQNEFTEEMKKMVRTQRFALCPSIDCESSNRGKMESTQRLCKKSLRKKGNPHRLGQCLLTYLKREVGQRDGQ
eukprot:TRINITY_DN2916_c0_g1_i9.p1 TRINITY_DN2916_c0_g1~~TRINITY_DN2916_c0_g1_i9.p1  ORF type:complete len:164 (-),score=1.36 TRINITY_DN2916_c0_g1_i9:185-676(-)